MNIYVTSYGIDVRYKEYMNSYKEIINILKDKKVAIICNAKLKTEDRTTAIVVKEELNKFNIFADIIDLDERNFKISEYESIYFSGGEPKVLMDAIINNNYYNEILDFINAGNTIIGQSAGAMILSKKYVDTSTGSLKLFNDGFDIFNKIIIPHYNNLDSDLLKLIPSNIFKINDNDKLIKIK